METIYWKILFAKCLNEDSRLLVIRAGAVQGMAACDALNRCLDSLAADYTSVKFCRIRASEARLSINFVRFLFFLIVNIFVYFIVISILYP